MITHLSGAGRDFKKRFQRFIFIDKSILIYVIG